VIEVAYTSVADDKGEKRLLYESLNVKEYWVIDVQEMAVTAFAMHAGGSHRIQLSSILPGFKLKQLEAALQRSRQTDHSEVMAWLITQFQ
jgi:Uma2 family endonuclease